MRESARARARARKSCAQRAEFGCAPPQRAGGGALWPDTRLACCMWTGHASAHLPNCLQRVHARSTHLFACSPACAGTARHAHHPPPPIPCLLFRMLRSMPCLVRTPLVLLLDIYAARHATPFLGRPSRRTVRLSPRLRKVALAGTLRVVLTPLLPHAPGFGAVLVTMPRAPQVGPVRRTRCRHRRTPRVVVPKANRHHDASRLGPSCCGQEHLLQLDFHAADGNKHTQTDCRDDTCAGNGAFRCSPPTPRPPPPAGCLCL